MPPTMTRHAHAPALPSRLLTLVSPRQLLIEPTMVMAIGMNKGDNTNRRMEIPAAYSDMIQCPSSAAAECDGWWQRCVLGGQGPDRHCNVRAVTYEAASGTVLVRFDFAAQSGHVDVKASHNCC